MKALASDYVCVLVHADDVLDTVRDLQKHTTFAQALISAANGQWCQDLGNTPETLAANLSALGTGGVWRSELIAEIRRCFEVSQVDAHGQILCVYTGCECMPQISCIAAQAKMQSCQLNAKATTHTFCIDTYVMQFIPWLHISGCCMLAQR